MSNEWMTNALLAGGKVAHPDEMGLEVYDDMGLGFFKRLSRGAKSIGRAVGGTVRAGSKGISGALRAVPAIGPGLDAVWKLNPIVTPINVAANVVAGKRIDKAVYEGLKERIKAYQDIGPYVQTVISVVPAVGPGVSGAIGAANALSKGRPITEALIEGARGALPGGPLAAAAFDMAVAGIQGKPITEIALNALPIPLSADQKKMMVSGIMAAKDIADGKRVDEALYDRGKALLPPEAQKALQIGIAIAQGQKLQQIAAREVPKAIPSFFKLGNIRIGANPVLKAGSDVLKSQPQVHNGFLAGLGFMQHKITPPALLSMRSALTGDQKKGFDIAVSTHIGQVAKPQPASVPPKKAFGFYATQGMQGNKAGRKTEMMKTLVKDKDVRIGAGKAVAQIKKEKPKAKERGFWAFWHKFITKLKA